MTNHNTDTKIDPGMLEQASTVLKTLGHPVRLAIIQFIDENEHNVTEIYQAIGEPQAITSQHLRLMEQREILSSRRDGQQVYYRLRDEFIMRILECIKQCAT